MKTSLSVSTYWIATTLRVSRRASALTMQTYGCKVDPEDPDFGAKFDTAFQSVKSKLNSIEARRTVPKVFLLSSTRKIVTQVVADWGCVGFLAPNDPVFQDRFQAAYAVEVLKLKVSLKLLCYFGRPFQP